MEDAGPGPCASSDDCANPTPYCNVMLGKCVQCIADLNCFGIGLVCDQNRGVCTNCRSNADCYQPAPYCSGPLARCVECLTDANCGKQGIKCADGVCGSCGDGICSANERNGMFGFCNDCFAGCPKTDLKSKVGDNVVSATTSSTDGQFTTSCGTPPGAAATYSWTAPDTGSYAFTVTGDAALSIYDTNCAGQPLSCNSYYAGLYLSKGQTVALIASGTTTTASTNSRSRSARTWSRRATRCSAPSARGRESVLPRRSAVLRPHRPDAGLRSTRCGEAGNGRNDRVAAPAASLRATRRHVRLAQLRRPARHGRAGIHRNRGHAQWRDVDGNGSGRWQRHASPLDDHVGRLRMRRPTRRHFVEGRARVARAGGSTGVRPTPALIAHLARSEDGAPGRSRCSACLRTPARLTRPSDPVVFAIQACSARRG